MQVEVLELAHLLRRVPLLIPETDRCDQKGHAQPASDTCASEPTAGRAARPRRRELGARGRYALDPRQGAGACLLQPVDGARTHGGRPEIEVAGERAGQTGFVVGHSVIPRALSVSARA